MQHLGDIRLGDTIDMKFTTVSTSGVPTQLAGSPAVAAYPGNSTTEVTAGITLTVDFDTRTGLNNVRVVATSGNGYATATDYALVITAGTVSGSSVVGYVVGHFSIEKRSALMPTTAARTVVVDANGRVDVGSVSGTAQTAGDIIGDTNDIQSRLPTSLVSGRIDASVGAMASNVITSSAIQDGALTAAKAGSGFFDAVWSVAARTLTAFGFSVTVGTNNDKTGYGLADDAITAAKIATDAIGASEIAAGAANKIADHTLRRTFANAAASSDGDTKGFRSLLGAVAKLVNKWVISGGTLTVYEADDSTSLGTQAVTGTAGADPITTLDTN